MTRRSSAFRRWRRRAGARLGALVIRASCRTVRLESDGGLLGDGAAIYVFWHGRFWLAAGRLGRPGTAVLVSLSEDGEVIARAARDLGFHPVRGSSSRGGREGLAALGRCLAEGRDVAITPDGPRGPRETVQIGAVVLAARSGRPVVPIGIASRPVWRLNSWDRFQIPKPWARAVAIYGAPLRVPDVPDLEPWRQRLETALRAAQRRAEEALAP